MPRSSRAGLALVVVLLLVPALLAATGGPVGAQRHDRAAGGAPGRPNVVLILTDDMRADELRFMPNVQRLLVDKGVRFRNAIAPHPMCCPARASLFTGQYGQNNGIRHNTGPWGGDLRLLRRDENIGRWLARAGYRTAFHGKFLNDYENHPWRPAGWSTWDAQVGGIYAYWRARFFNGDTYSGRYISRVMTERTHRTLGQLHSSGAPFFQWINHVAPHTTVDEPLLPLYEPRYADAYADLMPLSFDDPAFDEGNISDLPPAYRFPRVSRDWIVRWFRARLRALRSVDDAVGATVRRLRRLGELDDTYVVFTSDNGHGLGEHRVQQKNLLVDEALDIPLVVRGPGVPAGGVVDERVSLVDLPATFLDLAGAEPGRRIDGLSLRPLLDGAGALDRDTILVQTGDAVRDETPGWSYRGVSTGRYLYGHRAGHPETGVLFDRQQDPAALVNQFEVDAYAAVRRQLRERTVELAACAGVRSCNQVFGPLPDPG